MDQEYIDTLLKIYTKKDLAKFTKIKKDLPKEVHIHDPKADGVDICKLNPEYIYDKKHGMLYHRIQEGAYKHVA